VLQPAALGKVPPAKSERKVFATLEACGACIKFPVVSDGSEPACDDAYIPEPVHPRYRPSRVKSFLFTDGPSQDRSGTWMKRDELSGRRKRQSMDSTRG